MISRREVVTGGVLGTLAGPTTEGAQSEAAVQRELNQIEQQIQRLGSAFEAAVRVTGGTFMTQIRDRFTTHLRATGKFPDFLEIGTEPFYEVYDWHVRYQQQIQITRIAENRFAIQWMFTQLIVRFENDPKYLGVPFDRG